MKRVGTPTGVAASSRVSSPAIRRVTKWNSAEPGGEPGCFDCACEECVCAQDPYCCDTVWDSLCVDQCQADCGGCPGGDDDDSAGDDDDDSTGDDDDSAGSTPDTVARLVELAVASSATLEEAVVSLKDRLVGDGRIGPDERPLIEALLGRSLEAVIGAEDGAEAALRGLCGALLASPNSYLTLVPVAGAEPPSLSLDQAADCARATQLMSAQGISIDCN